jgi:uncharacterized protein
MKTRILMLVIGVALGAYLGGFISSETITYYNITRIAPETMSFAEIMNDTEVSMASVIVPAVDQDGKGVATLLEVTTIPGSRRALVDIDKLLFFTDTQNSIRISRSVIENVTGTDLSFYDIIYSIQANASVIEGPSAGAAMTIATIAALLRQEINPGVMITGTINPDGTIGQVGEILAKAMAAREIGADLILVPPGQSQQVIFENKENCRLVGSSNVCNTERVPKTIDVGQESGIRVEEVRTIQEVMSYFFN